ncbi:MAG: hypothetical protein LBG88_02535 [Christensenellaceae bacterium]|jgi:hypothetical protein|nr:hypothetical protein [Christensenellaceae bacterium]
MKKFFTLKSLKIALITVLVLSGIGFLTVTIIGIFTVVSVPTHEYNFGQYTVGFFVSMFCYLVRMPIIGYEGLGTPTNVLMNYLFFIFLVAIILSSAGLACFSDRIRTKKIYTN